MRISENPMHTMKGIQSKFKLKDDKMEKPDVYLGADLSIMDNKQGGECWAISSDKYYADMVKTVEEIHAKKVLRLPTKCNLPTKHSYVPEMYCTGGLKADGLQLYQELIGSLRWSIEIIRVDILLETAILYKHFALPREGYLEQVLHIVGYLKRHKKL